ncbi:hypothetical protein Poly21_36830 [Allorhodopirellula heiligendammensis]|uniref:Uncharacterized protein n=2 Tax=Allorhodopirellula heiligendammensis TaxID=2714739 RepID=A0A5C6BX81_9BACT|nr:hypothetical protein Poly21_36830 [Allorhodopirellula heiligendammensis]
MYGRRMSDEHFHCLLFLNNRQADSALVRSFHARTGIVMRYIASFRKQMFTPLVATVAAVASPSAVLAEDTPGYYTNPDTGIVYRQVIRTIERPVVETKMMEQQHTVYQPKTVVETRPATRRTYTPVTESRWLPRVEGRWNPFRQPTVAYQHVPEIRWQARDEVVSETTTQVQWEAVTQTIQVPQRLTRMTREQKVDFEPVGRVPASSASSLASNVSPEVAAKLQPLASKLQPLGSNVQYQPLNGGVSPASSLAAQGSRSTLQTGLRATELMPQSPPLNHPAGMTNTSNVAGLVPPSIWR